MLASKSVAYREDSDADDEYERDLLSPTIPGDFPHSPTESDVLSTEQTPTYSHRDGIISPRGKIIDWSADQSADFVAELGLEQYADTFVDESITGDALVALLHADLKDMGINSIGHRLTILKGVYDLKVRQNITIEPDHYVPLSADSNAQDIPPTQNDLAKIIAIIKERDAEMRSLREDLAKLSEENRKLREEVLPLVKATKDRLQPLPTPDDNTEFKTGVVQGLSRKFSNKRIFLSNSGPKNSNPSPTIQERNGESSSLDPSPAAMAASSHLQVRDGLNSPNQTQTSPTSPAYASAPGSAGPTARPFPRNDNSDYGVSLPTPALSTSAGPPGSVSTPLTSNPPTATATTPGGSSSSSAPPIEIFKSFRVSIDDPCHKVLPVALKKYNISADWRQYALYIVHGDQERCLGLNEKPLILFKQLDKEGRKPMFMLRKHAAPAEGHVIIGGGPPQSISAASLPGGVL